MCWQLWRRICAMAARQRGSCSIRCRRWSGRRSISVSFWLQLMGDLWSVVAGVGIALSGVPMVCQREKHETRLVVELSVIEMVGFLLSQTGENLFSIDRLHPSTFNAVVAGIECVA